MSQYQETMEKLFGKYEKPVIEDITIGYTGIDPQKRYMYDDDHEILRGLLGGNDNGHYHLTLAELMWLREQMDVKYPPVIAEGQVLNLIDSEEMEEYEIQGDNLKPTITENQEITVLLSQPMTPYQMQGTNTQIGD